MAIVTAIRHGRARLVVSVRPLRMIPVVTSVTSAASPVRHAAAMDRTAGSASLASASNASRSAALTGLGRSAAADGAGLVVAVPGPAGTPAAELACCGSHQDVRGGAGAVVGRRKLTPQPVACSGAPGWGCPQPQPTSTASGTPPAAGAFRPVSADTRYGPAGADDRDAEGLLDVQLVAAARAGPHTWAETTPSVLNAFTCSSPRRYRSMASRAQASSAVLSYATSAAEASPLPSIFGHPPRVIILCSRYGRRHAHSLMSRVDEYRGVWGELCLMGNSMGPGAGTG